MSPKGPILFDLEAETPRPRPSPAEALPVPELLPEIHSGAAMTRAVQIGARGPSWLARLFWGALLGLIGILVSVAAWDFGLGLLARNPVLGWTAAGLGAVLGLVALVAVARELAALARLKRIDGLRTAALGVQDLGGARRLTARIAALYTARPDMRWPLERLAEAEGNIFDPEAQLALAETHLLAPLDAQATQAIEAAARQVATVTAFVPLALADVVAALLCNLRMIRAVAQIYGGRGGALGSWRLTRGVMAHLVATGAVAVGDDLIGSVAGGGVLAKVSRRFGEGVVNGALTARVGVAAMEVCRPLPFRATPPPSITGILRRAVAGVFGAGS